MSLIEDAIKKYGGGDEAHEQSLKNHMREAMGYSSFVNKANAAANRPLSLNLKGNITPAGVKQLVGGAMGMNEQAEGAYGDMAGAIDSTAGGLASAQAARGRAAAANSGKSQGFENGVAFQVQDPLDEAILSYMQNPKNADGSVKSLQQFEAELSQQFGEQASTEQSLAGLSQNNSMYNEDGSMKSIRQSQEEISNANTQQTQEQASKVELLKKQINERIANRVPSDFIGNEDKYHLMAQGLSEKQAVERTGALRYDTMTEPEKLVYGIQNPTMAEALNEGSLSQAALSDLHDTIDRGNGKIEPKFTYTELKENNKGISDASLKEQAVPIYRKSLMNDVNTFLQLSRQDTINGEAMKAAYNGSAEDDDYGFVAVEKTPQFKDIVQKMNIAYGDLFNEGEIKMMIKAELMNN